MSRRFCKSLILLIGIPWMCMAVTIKDGAPQEYKVKKGDTLWDIAGLYLEHPWQWPELWRNNLHIRNPHLIYPGDELRLRFDEQGQPYIEKVAAVEKGVLKLTPSGEKVQKNKAIPVLPWALIQPYVNGDQILSEEDYQQLPRILGDADGGIRFAANDLVLAQSQLQSGQYEIVRSLDPIVDMQRQTLGIHVRHIADAQPVADTGLEQQSLVKVQQGRFEAQRGDRLVPKQPMAQPDLQLQAADTQKGYVVDSLVQQSMLGKYDAVILDLGSDQVVPGMVFGVYVQGPDIIDADEPAYADEPGVSLGVFSLENYVAQPALKVGEVVVFQVFEKASYALITKTTNFVRRGAIVANP